MALLTRCTAAQQWKWQLIGKS